MVSVPSIPSYLALKSNDRFKLHLRPKALAASHITDADIPALPRGKTALDIFADFLRYLFAAAKAYIIETTPSGVSLWNSVEHNIDFVLTHPNGWEGQQQGLMRRAAVVAGLIEDGIGQERLQFVTEGEASLHFCINKNVLTKDQIVSSQRSFLSVLFLWLMIRQNGKGIIIVDAGGGTVDLSAYANKTNKDNAFEEIAPTECEQSFVPLSISTYIPFRSSPRFCVGGAPSSSSH